MLIRCLLKRPGGTAVELGTAQYLFRPAEKVGDDHPDFLKLDHVCDVGEPQHIKRFLSITDAYELALPGDKPVAVKIASSEEDNPDTNPAEPTPEEVAAAAAAAVDVSRMDKLAIFEYVTAALPDLLLNAAAPLPTLRKQLLKGIEEKARADAEKVLRDKAIAKLQADLAVAKATFDAESDPAKKAALADGVNVAQAALDAAQAESQ